MHSSLTFLFDCFVWFLLLPLHLRPFELRATRQLQVIPRNLRSYDCCMKLFSKEKKAKNSNRNIWGAMVSFTCWVSFLHLADFLYINLAISAFINLFCGYLVFYRLLFYLHTMHVHFFHILSEYEEFPSHLFISLLSFFFTSDFIRLLNLWTGLWTFLSKIVDVWLQQSSRLFYTASRARLPDLRLAL